MSAATSSARVPASRILRDVTAVVAVFVATAALIRVAAGGTGPAVFINEVHYDNVGTDTGEFIEIAGPAGTI